MSASFQLPNINAKDEAGQLVQIRKYLYELVGQLNWAMQSVPGDSGTNGLATGTTTSATLPAGNLVDPGSGTASSPISPIASFNAIKSLIIKSADIVRAFYAEIVTLLEAENRYVAESEFGRFVEETHNALYADGTGIKHQITNLQSIFDEDGNIKAELLVNGHIYSGILSYAKSGEAIIGLEIGQTTTNESGEEVFNRFARFTAEKLAFYGPHSTGEDDPLAYISGYNLVIKNAEIGVSFRMSGFVDMVCADRSIVTKWVDGGETNGDN